MRMGVEVSNVIERWRELVREDRMDTPSIYLIARTLTVIDKYIMNHRIWWNISVRNDILWLVRVMGCYIDTCVAKGIIGGNTDITQ